jgi:hypothetical protein
VAEDALQVTGLDISRHWGPDQPIPGDVVVRVRLRWRVRDQLRRRGDLVFRNGEALEQAVNGSGKNHPATPEDETVLREALQNHQACVAGLPDSPEEPVRTVHLRSQAGQNDREIAAQLHIPYSRARRLRMHGNVLVRTCLIRRICHNNQHFLAVLGECEASLPGPLCLVWRKYKEGLPLGTIARQIRAGEDCTLGLLEDAAEHVLCRLIGRLFGG